MELKSIKSVYDEIDLNNIKKGFHEEINKDEGNLDAQKKFLDTKLQMIEKYTKDYGKVGNNVIYKLILLNEEKRKAFLKERSKIIIRIKCEEATTWLLEQKKILNYIRKEKEIKMIHWIPEMALLDILFDRLYKEIFDDDSGRDIFKSHFTKDVNSSFNRSNPIPRYCFNHRMGTLCSLLRALNNQQCFIGKNIQSIKYIDECTPLMIYYAFADKNGEPYNFHSLQSTWSRTKKATPSYLKEIFKKILPLKNNC